MVISWYGHSCFKIQSGETVIIIDPFNKEIGLTPPRQVGADILLISHKHDDHSNTEAIGGTPFLIDGPGEYEVKGINIRGIFSFHDDAEGKERGSNTIYMIKAEDIRICHLGDLGQKKLTDEQVDLMGAVDILMAPVGGHFTIDASEAVKVINQIEPKIVIPMHYKTPDLKMEIDSLKDFIKEIGMEKKEIDKLTIKKKDIPEEEMELIVFKS